VLDTRQTTDLPCVFICRVRHSANRPLCRVPDEIHSARQRTCLR
jgi:hypothetical protein